MELVKNNNGQIVTNSLLVAEHFGKEHRVVLKAIDDILGVAQNYASLYEETSYVHPQNKQTFRMYVMNRDGFSLLVMGFTGKKAMKFKMDFIEQFNAMEQTIKQTQSPALSQIDIILQSALVLKEQEQRISAVEEKIKIIENQTKAAPDYFTVAGYAALNGFNASLPVCAAIGRMASKECKVKNIATDKIPDPRFGVVKTYPMNILRDVFTDYFQNVNFSN